MKSSIFMMIIMIFTLFFSTASRSALVCPAPVPDQFSKVRPGKVVAAYFANWAAYGENGYQVDDIYPIASRLTHIIYAFAKPNSETGKCELQDPWIDVGANFEDRKKLAGNFAKLIKLKKQFPHLKILLSIGGGSDSKYISKIVKEGKWKIFVDSAVQLLDRFEYTFKNKKTGENSIHIFEYEQLFDGIDLDWEWLNNVVPEGEAQACQNMVDRLKRLLNERHKKYSRGNILTVALQVHPSVYKSLNLSKMANMVDWFNVMAYNFSGSFSRGVGFNAPICNQWSPHSVDSAVHGLMIEGLSPAKIVLGIPLYGQIFNETSGKIGAAFEKGQLTGSISFEKIKRDYFNDEDCKYSWNKISQAPYLYCAPDQIFISFDDENSVKAKIDYAKWKRLKGVVFWKLGDDGKDHSLIGSF